MIDPHLRRALPGYTGTCSPDAESNMIDRDDYTKETLTHCDACNKLRWIMDGNGGLCSDCLEKEDQVGPYWDAWAYGALTHRIREVRHAEDQQRELMKLFELCDELEEQRRSA